MVLGDNSELSDTLPEPIPSVRRLATTLPEGMPVVGSYRPPTSALGEVERIQEVLHGNPILEPLYRTYDTK